MKVWLAHSFYTHPGTFKSHYFLFPISISLVNESLNCLIGGEVVLKIGFIHGYLIDIKACN